MTMGDEHAKAAMNQLLPPPEAVPSSDKSDVVQARSCGGFHRRDWRAPVRFEMYFRTSSPASRPGREVRSSRP